MDAEKRCLEVAMQSIHRRIQARNTVEHESTTTQPGRISEECQAPKAVAEHAAASTLTSGSGGDFAAIAVNNLACVASPAYFAQ